ncbi:hypothetical protein O181_068231 [Austropuccinia psidii MF-1]|uniref:Uncharacterized protein n=1 Tax=Austropuccinia psidii MF-1 TaxID=1389203 RepID=A0A9Q3F170_9BASI|nr:hypothetical protein [Austropuccinia psidii MF-1]
MLLSTCVEKATNNDTKTKPLSNEEVCTLLNSVKSACSFNAAKMKSLQMALLSLLPCISSFQHTSSLNSSPYDGFMQEPYCTANRFVKLLNDGSNFPAWHCTLPASHFYNVQEIEVEANELKGLLVQALSHTCPALDQEAFNQLITAAILSKGEEKPLLTFVIQVIINALHQKDEQLQELSPFVYCVSDPLEPTPVFPRPFSPYYPRPMPSVSKLRWPPSHLVDKFGASSFHCRCTSHWCADSLHTRGVDNPNPGPSSPTPYWPSRPATADRPPQKGSGGSYKQESIPQVHFVKHNTSDKVYIDTGASIHLSGALCFVTPIRPISPFCIFFADFNSSILISQMMTLNLPVNNGSVVICAVPYSQKISGTILLIGCLFMLGVVPVFDDLALSLFVSGFLVTTNFSKKGWWMDVLPGEGTKGLAAVTSSHNLLTLEMNLISQPTTTSLSSREWHEGLGHACDKMLDAGKSKGMLAHIVNAEALGRPCLENPKTSGRPHARVSWIRCVGSGGEDKGYENNW